MDKEKFLEQITLIGTEEDDIKRRELLAEMQEDISEIFDSNIKLEKENEELTNDNENLRSANMKLFLKVGEQKPDSEVIQSKTGIKQEPVTKRKFEDLFNEKGGIK